MRLWRATITAEANLSRAGVSASAVLLLAAAIASSADAESQAPRAPPAPDYAHAEAGGTAAAQLNMGALPSVRASEGLLPPVPELTGARCEAGLLRVSIPIRQRHGFINVMTLAGSYHVFDYNLFYTNIRVNVRERISAYREAAAAPSG